MNISTARFTVFPASLALAVSLTACSGDDTAETGGNRVTIADTQSPYRGKTMAEWGAEWWRWAYEIPASVNPTMDETGASCGEHQTRDVFFLAGNFGGTSVRTCAIPAGKPVFFPILNAAADNCGVPAEDQSTNEENRGFTEEMMAAVNAMSLEIDGETIGSSPSDLARFRTMPVEFSYQVPADDSLYDSWESDFEGNCSPSYTAGYWVMLDPLPPGEHTIHFAGTSGEGEAQFSLDVTYNLTVE
ncbi:MAG: hypothetical protein IT379_23395 [Deltaproteobacteria bacterium]|nr:hypothetical protein [Deltaproteobacteria bacterium]